MKSLTVALLVALSSNVFGALVPASEVHTAPVVRAPIDRVAAAIANTAENGYRLVVVDLKDTTWKEENAIMAQLKSLGYKVELHRDQAVYGMNLINGALLIKW